MSAVRTRSVALVVIAAALWGFIGVLIRGLSDLGLDSLQINGARTWISMIMLAVILYFYDRSLFRIRKGDVLILVFVAAMKLLMDICYVQAQVMLDLSLAAVLLNTGCYFALILTFILYRSGITGLRILAVFVGFFGCVLMMGLLDGDFDDVDPVGVLIGLGSGAFGAFYSVGLKKSMERGVGGTTALFYVFLFGAIMILPFMQPADTVTSVFSGWNYVGIVLALGFFFTLVPYYLYTVGLRHLEPSTVNVLLFVEVAMAAVAGLLVFGEDLPLEDIAGLLLILASIFMVEREKPGEE